MDRGAWWASLWGQKKVGHDLVTEHARVLSMSSTTPYNVEILTTNDTML